MSDLDLMVLLRKRKDYRKEALAVAEKEFASRNISPDQLQDLEAQAQEKIHREQGLETREILLFILLPFVAWMIAKKYEKQGLERKYNESWRFLKLGIFIYLAVSFLVKAGYDGTLFFF